MSDLNPSQEGTQANLDIGTTLIEAENEREALQRIQERLEMAQQVAHIGTFEWDIPRNRLLWTPELEALYGLPPGGLENDYENWVQRIHADDRKQVEESFQAAATDNAPYHIEFRAIWPDGATCWILATGQVSRYDGRGHPRRMVGAHIDITERKEAEQALTLMNQRLQDLNANLESTVAARTEALEQSTEELLQANTELQRSNQELQDFAYVASHDLQEPLRKIQAFGNLLEEEYGKQLGDGKAYLDRMRNAAGRMRVLIDDLLTFSRVTTKAQPFSSVDLNVIAHDVIDDLFSRLQITRGSIEVEQLPTIEADPHQMYQMLQNLLSNALKFHQPDQPPVVKLHGSLREPPDSSQHYVLFIEDNGIGFEEKYLDRIFTVFQRLHARGSIYEGTGIGLAVVRKIVERHGGTITATSTPGKGSTFIVTLPLCQSTSSLSPGERDR